MLRRSGWLPVVVGGGHGVLLGVVVGCRWWCSGHRALRGQEATVNRLGVTRARPCNPSAARPAGPTSFAAVGDAERGKDIGLQNFAFAVELLATRITARQQRSMIGTASWPRWVPPARLSAWKSLVPAPAEDVGHLALGGVSPVGN